MVVVKADHMSGQNMQTMVVVEIIVHVHHIKLKRRVMKMINYCLVCHKPMIFQPRNVDESTRPVCELCKRKVTIQ